MTCIILVYYIFTSDITYLSFTAIARCSIPVEKPPAFLSDLLPNFLGVSKWKYSVWISHVLITKYLSQHFLQRVNPEGKVLVAIPVAFSHVVTREMALCYGCSRTLVQILKSVDLINLIVAVSSSAVHLYATVTGTASTCP
jgi:hypothetical protein